MNSWEISLSQEKDDFLVHMKVEMTKLTASHRKKRCFLKERNRTLPLFKIHTHIQEEQIHAYSKQKKSFSEIKEKIPKGDISW